jgi:transposase
MSNILKESMKNNIIKLGEFGWTKRRISRELGVHRNTVTKYLPPEPKCTIPTAGYCEGNESKCTIPTAGKTGRKSICEKYDGVIREKLSDGLSAQRIYQDLCAESGFSGSYESVKRYARKLRSAAEIPFRRMEKLPGEECQIDYGKGAWITGEDGKRRRPHLFRMTLSYSRKAYSEVSFTQSTENFLRAMENGFRFFGGVPDTVKIDNLKAGVIRSDFYDPDLNPKLRDFADHYGTCIMPTRVRTPRHKGKVERSVGYAQDNALKKREFLSLGEQNAFLREWEINVADRRIHGTVRRQVRAMFQEEKPHLRTLPCPATITF